MGRLAATVRCLLRAKRLVSDFPHELPFENNIRDATTMKTLNQKILTFWKQCLPDRAVASDELPPLLYPPFRRGGTLVVGFNPSFARLESGAIMEAWRSVVRSKEDVQIETLADLQTRAHVDHPHFKERTQTLGKLSGLPGPIQHYDLFPFRESQQIRLERRIDGESLGHSLQGKALDWFLGLVRECRPNLVWIANKGTWRILKVALNHPCTEEIPIERGRAFFVPTLVGKTPAVVTNPIGFRYPRYRHTAADLKKIVARFRQGPIA